MKKLTLNLDVLKVETFEPEASTGEQQGSVAAHLASALECPTGNKLDLLCYYSVANPPGGVCTAVCGPTARCEPTEYPCIG